MPSPSDLLQAGVNALKHKRYAEAVQALEAFCHSQATARSKDFFQAQMYLVKAYQDQGQIDQAIALCRQMIQAEHPQVRAWAERILPTIIPSVSDLTQVETSATETENSQLSSSAPSVASVVLPDPEAILPPEESARLLKEGNSALKLRKFAVAVTALEAYCRGTDLSDKDYAQAQMWLVKAYKGAEQTEPAIALCQFLLESEQEYVRIWAKQMLQTIAPEPESADNEPEPSAPTNHSSPAFVNAATGKGPQQAHSAIPKAGRSDRRGVNLKMRGVAANLSVASGVTLSLLAGMVLVLCLSLMLIVDSENPTLGLLISAAVTIVFNTVVFFIAPLIMDLIQTWLYGTRWMALSEVQRYSPETARVIREVCQQKHLSEPRLGIIEDDNPTAFTYGSLPNTARLVVSRGLFKYLDDDEVATVYAHELGHIVHWDFAVMTLASTLVQIAYLLYVYIREVADRLGDSETANKIKNSARATALMAYVFYLIGEYLLLYLSRTREYYADHFAAEVTGNPNALSRALVKIAYGILEEGQRNPQPSKLIQGTRALGIADPKVATLTGTAYRVAAEPQKVGRIFLWDMFNPWAWWMELSSTHPLTGKRVRALSTYAEQLGLNAEFEMSRVMREGRNLNKQRLYGSFVLDVVVLWADWLGLAIGIAIGVSVLMAKPGTWMPLVSASLLGFGFGTLLKMVFMYPDFKRAPETDVLTLMSDPYASPLRGRAVQLTGEVIGRGDAGYRFGSDLKLQDPTGMMYLHYSSRFGPLGNWLFGMSQADSFVRKEVTVVGWFRRGLMPWVDFVRMDCPSKWTVHSYHRFWTLLLGLGAIALGFAVPSLALSLL
jgi:Zn-dependent protease with chaperone function